MKHPTIGYIIPQVIFTQELPQLPNTPIVTMDSAGLKTLIDGGDLKAAINLTTKCLSSLNLAAAPPQGRFSILEMWTCRFQLFLALKMHQELLQELDLLGDLGTPDTYFQYFPELRSQGLSGSIVPFNLRLIHAEAMLYSPNPWTALTRVLLLEDTTKDILNQYAQSSNDLWMKRLHAVQLLKGRIFYKLKEYKAALSVYEKLLGSASREEERTSLLKMLVRLAISEGDEKRVDSFMAQLSASSSDEHAMHKCMKAIFHGDFGVAQTAIHGLGSAGVPKTTEHMNNEAICMLYNGQVESALHTLLRRQDALVEPIAINLEIISDLGSTSGKKFKR